MMNAAYAVVTVLPMEPVIVLAMWQTVLVNVVEVLQMLVVVVAKLVLQVVIMLVDQQQKMMNAVYVVVMVLLKALVTVMVM